LGLESNAYNLELNKTLPSFLGILSQMFEVWSFETSSVAYYKTSCRAETCKMYKARWIEVVILSYLSLPIDFLRFPCSDTNHVWL